VLIPPQLIDKFDHRSSDSYFLDNQTFYNPLSTGSNLPSLTVTKTAYPNRSLSSENWSGYPDVSFLGRLAFANFLNTEFLLALHFLDDKLFRFLRLFYGELIEKCQCNKLRKRKLLALA
jgi:hypothetical protein